MLNTVSGVCVMKPHFSIVPVWTLNGENSSLTRGIAGALVSKWLLQAGKRGRHFRVAVTFGWLYNVYALTVVSNKADAQRKNFKVPLRYVLTTHINKADCILSLGLISDETNFPHKTLGK